MRDFVYLNTFVNKFRDLLNDKTLLTSDIHTILALCDIKPNKQNQYSSQLLNLLLQGYIVSNSLGMEVSRKDIIKAYNKVQTSKINHDYDFLRREPLEKFPSIPTMSKKKDEDDGVYWEDGGEDMNNCDKLLQQQYQNENSYRNKTIIITEEQFFKIKEKML